MDPAKDSPQKFSANFEPRKPETKKMKIVKMKSSKNLDRVLSGEGINSCTEKGHGMTSYFANLDS